MTRKQVAYVATQLGPEPGWTDLPETILKPETKTVKILGRFFVFDGNRCKCLVR